MLHILSQMILLLFGLWKHGNIIYGPKNLLYILIMNL